MCGINGLFRFGANAPALREGELLATRDHMAQRGPDGCGSWWSDDRRVGLGHRRLSIIDLSEAASQPMLSPDRRLAITFNGEIYNYQALQRGLEQEGVVFRSGSDTEVLLHLYARKGAAMLKDLRGMFAFAIWDAAREGLFLARDPYGIKPLYYAAQSGTYRFASQVKALVAGGGVSKEPDAAGSAGFLIWGNVPEPFTLFRAVQAVPAGCSQWVDAAGARAPEPYVNISAILSEGLPGSARSDRSALIRAAVLDSVSHHLVADVEVGVFLSAGIDSGAILGLMRDAGQSRVRGVTLAFQEFVGTEEDESRLAAETAHLYGAEHIVRTVDEAEFTEDLPRLIAAMDQPSIDGVNTWFVAKATREQGLKVTLSGLGGDELLGGYPSFRDIPRWVRWMKAPSHVPGLALLARTLAQTVAPDRMKASPKLAGMIEYGGDYCGAYLLRRGLFLPFELGALCDPATLRDGLERLDPVGRLHAGLAPDPGSAHGRVTVLESLNYMRCQLLRDADWAGMAHSLEIRTPLVDIELLKRLAVVIPSLAPGEGKAALADAPSVPLPDHIAKRRKTGFVVPTAAWRSRAVNGAGAATSKGVTSRLWAREVLDLQTAQAA